MEIIVVLICSLIVFTFFICAGLKNLPRFHKGQKVKVKAKLNNLNDSYLEIYAGETLTIREIVSIGRPHFYLVFENDFLWQEDMFEYNVVKK